MAKSLAGDFIVPRFQAVALAAHEQSTAWAQFCANPKRGNVENLKQAYEKLGDAWSDVEFMHIGPAAVALRQERFNWWLDRTDARGKAFTAMMAAKVDDLVPEKLAAGSVAGQGLPMIERLLFPDSEAALLKKKDGAQRCIVGTAVARGQAAIADQIVADWTAPDGARAALIANTRWKVSFADASEAASVMMTDLVAGLESLKDLKVAMEFHDVMNPAAPRLAEATRSGRTLRDISRNMAAIRQGLAVFLTQATPVQKAQLDTAFDDAGRVLNDIETAKDDAARIAAVKKSLIVFGTLSQTAMTILPAATGLTLGFNNLDGD
ncbi:MAG TPA: imelysin family protein [Rhizomicrobium sp.]|nr:imelysin family protein [Rhizomicrobium sp.]